MANTAVNSDLVEKKFLSDFFKEYIRGSRFSRYTGTGVNNVIVIKEGRKKIEIPLVTRLKGNGVSGSNTLRGNGENIGNYGMELAPTYKRHAVEFDKEELEKPAIDLMKAAKPLLMDWAMELTRDEVITAFAAMHTGSAYVGIASASEANADAWLANNADRVLFGAAKSNNAANDHSAALAQLDSVNDTLSAGIVSLAKRMAKTADPHIRPIKTSEDEEWYVMFADPYAFRDLKEDSVMAQANREARNRGKDNPLFRDGDLIYDGVIIREVPEIADFVDGIDGTATTLNLVTGSADTGRVGMCFLCGTQAVGFGLGQRPKTVLDSTYDYGFQPGVACELKHDIKKMFFSNEANGGGGYVQHGLVTVYVSAAVDA